MLVQRFVEEDAAFVMTAPDDRCEDLERPRADEEFLTRAPDTAGAEFRPGRAHILDHYRVRALKREGGGGEGYLFAARLAAAARTVDSFTKLRHFARSKVAPPDGR